MLTVPFPIWFVVGILIVLVIDISLFPFLQSHFPLTGSCRSIVVMFLRFSCLAAELPCAAWTGEGGATFFQRDTLFAQHGAQRFFLLAVIANAILPEEIGDIFQNVRGTLVPPRNTLAQTPQALAAC